MKITTLNDLVKVNQILLIIQAHFGQSINLARIKLMARLTHALCMVQKEAGKADSDIQKT